MGHINLKSNVPLEELPKWFQDAKTINANVTFSAGVLTWKRGTWEDGTWEDGTWEYGTWRHGWKVFSGAMCKYVIKYNEESLEVRIGCKTKTVDEWDKFFRSHREYDTPRDTEEFKAIERGYKKVKRVILPLPTVFVAARHTKFGNDEWVVGNEERMRTVFKEFLEDDATYTCSLCELVESWDYEPQDEL